MFREPRSVTNTEQVPHENKRFVTFAEELLLQNRSVTDAEQVVPHEKEICYFCGSSYSCRTDLLQILSNLFLMRKSYCYRTDLLQMMSKLFLMRKRFVTFAEELFLQNRSVTTTTAMYFS